MLHLRVNDFEDVFNVGDAQVNQPLKLQFHLPEVFKSAKGTCGCTTTSISNDTLDVVFMAKPHERNQVVRKTIKLYRPDGEEEKIQFNATVV